ncbi:hypothetical protein D1AOALGA4SA_4293 [Olavius algarvensis Delta 1 endosymbiont]|nr:hypothetical protein D1AOALGA4SA_4293 [Olavius algarvensis Delta 1 endosymbiont]
MSGVGCQVSGVSSAAGQTNGRSNRIKKLFQIGELSLKRIRRFVLVLVLVREAFEHIWFRVRGRVRRRARRRARFKHPFWGLYRYSFIRAAASG